MKIILWKKTRLKETFEMDAAEIARLFFDTKFHHTEGRMFDNIMDFIIDSEKGLNALIDVRNQGKEIYWIINELTNLQKFAQDLLLNKGTW